MIYEVTFKLPRNATYTTKVVAEDKDVAEDVAFEALMNNIITTIEEQKIDGNAILDWIMDNMPNTNNILFRTDDTAMIFSTYDPAQMVILAERLYSAFEDFAKDNIDDDCTTVESLFNFCVTKEEPDFGEVCAIYYKDFDNNFIRAF